MRALDRPEVKALTISWVSFASGYRVDLGRLGGPAWVGNAGTYRCTGASRSRRPASASFTAAAAAKSFETLPTRKRVRRVTGTRCSTSASPNPSDHTRPPPATTATASRRSDRGAVTAR